MNSWKKIAWGLLLGKTLMISLVFIPWALSSDSEKPIESEKERRIMANNVQHITLTEENFQTQVLESAEPLLVDFWATWCGPCQVIAPVIEEVAVDFQGLAKVGKLEIDDHHGVAMQYGIRSIPTLLFFKDGHVVDQVIGVVPKKVIADKLEAMLGEPVPLHN